MGVENNIPEGWKEVPLEEILLKRNQGVNTTTEKVIYSTKGHRVVKAQDILERKINFSVSDYVDKHEYARLSTHVKPKLNDILYSNIGSKMGNAAKVKSDFQFIIAWNVLRLQINTDEAEVDFLVQLLNSKTIRRAICSLNSSSTMPFVSGGVIGLFEINLPPLPEQKAIAKVLTAFDHKIELLQAQNKTLETMAQTIFKEWFGKYQIGDDLPEGWRVGSLSEIADFLNGLALQKYPPKKGYETLPVIKIRELKQGVTSNTDRANTELDAKYIIDSGDVLFSWSGSLEVVIWQYGKGALNQHLFKVSSEIYPKWFYYHWVLHHLKEFKGIASSKATTMGHINRKHLDLAEVIIPDKETFKKLNFLFSPILEKIENNQNLIQSLTKTRDTLLPKLMSGQVRVNNLNQTADA